MKTISLLITLLLSTNHLVAQRSSKNLLGTWECTAYSEDLASMPNKVVISKDLMLFYTNEQPSSPPFNWSYDAKNESLTLLPLGPEAENTSLGLKQHQVNHQLVLTFPEATELIFKRVSKKAKIRLNGPTQEALTGKWAVTWESDQKKRRLEFETITLQADGKAVGIAQIESQWYLRPIANKESALTVIAGPGLSLDFLVLELNKDNYLFTIMLSGYQFVVTRPNKKAKAPMKHQLSN